MRMANWSSLEWVRLHVISRVTSFAFKFFSFTQNTVNRLSTSHACKLLNKYTLLLRLKKKTISKDKPIRSKNYLWTLANRVNILKGSSSFYKHSFAKRFSLRRHQHVHSPYNVCVMSNISVIRIEELVDWGRLLECKTISSLYAGETKENSLVDLLLSIIALHHLMYLTPNVSYLEEQLIRNEFLRRYRHLCMLPLNLSP